jgi:hypothetical protein
LNSISAQKQLLGLLLLLVPLLLLLLLLLHTVLLALLQVSDMMPHAVFFDEVHKLKNASSKQYEAASSLPTPYRFGLTGGATSTRDLQLQLLLLLLLLLPLLPFVLWVTENLVGSDKLQNGCSCLFE